MPFRIIRNDLTQVHADVIVNTANPLPLIGNGTDSAVYRAAGEAQLLAERKKNGPIEPGQAAATPAFALNAKHIIHTVGPAWTDGTRGEKDILASCYAQSLALADKLGAQSIAFPLIATGIYGFPRDEALRVALSEIGRFLLTHEMDVTLVVFDRTAFELSARLVRQIDAYIDEHSVQKISENEYGTAQAERYAANRKRLAEEERAFRRPVPPAAGPRREEQPAPPVLPDARRAKSLDDLLDTDEDDFRQRLFRLIDQKGLSDSAVYGRANISRKVFSSIRCKDDYRPTKKNSGSFRHRAGAGSSRRAGPARPGRVRPLPQQSVRPDHHLFRDPRQLRHLRDQRRAVQIRPADPGLKSTDGSFVA